MFSDNFFKFLFELLGVAGIAVGVAYVTFAYLGKKWLDNKFSKSFEDFKHKQNLQMEQYRFEINSLFNRVSKIHEREFEVLPELWFKLQDCLGKVSKLISPYQEYPDLNNKNNIQITEILDKTKFEESEKEEILKSSNKNKKYSEISFWHLFADVRNSVYDFHNYLLYNKIFLSKDLFDCFSKLDKFLLDAVQQREYMERSKDYTLITKIYGGIRDGTMPIVQEIESLIQQRLHYQDAE